jgi:hypothetical protein
MAGNPGPLPWVHTRWPALGAIGVYLFLTAVLAWLGMRQTAGTFVYAQDDPYIHLTLARTLAGSGVWGIRPSAFAGASSSPLWTLLLAGLQRSGGPAALWPLVLNLLSGTALLLVVSRIIERERLHRLQLPLLLAMVVVTPLPTLALIGLEHTLFILLAIAFCRRIAIHASHEGAESALATSLLGAALVATRYEGLFLIAASTALLLFKRRWAIAAQVTLAATLPVVAYAAFSLTQGGAILPSSVLMKSGPSRFVSVGAGVAAILADWLSVVQLFNRPAQSALTLAVLLALALTWEDDGTASRRSRAMALLFVAASLLHACLVKMEWFFRYEAYLIAAGVLAAGLVAGPSSIALRSGGRKRLNAAAMALVILLAAPLAVRALTALAVTPGAMRNVYQQQYQMALFFRDAYPRDAIALNDIGAVSWLAPSRIVDVMGLATPEIADLKRHGQFNRETLAAVIASKDVRAIAMYEQVFAPVIPRSWQLVAEWQIPENVGVSEDTVGFFAPTSADATRLRLALDAFRPRLPPAVQYRSPLEREDQRSRKILTP